MFRFFSQNWTLCFVCFFAMGGTSAQAQGEPQDETLTTKDGVQLKVSYYQSSLGQEAVPIVILHDYKENRAMYNSLASALQNPPKLDPSDPDYESNAVVTVDLRGHGGSTKATGFNGQTQEIDVDRLRTADFRKMVALDMEAVRKFLVTKNDAKELNLNKLCLIGAGMGANVAASWTLVDWSAPPLAVGKQGQDVKAMVMMSPSWNYKGLSILKALKNPGVREKVSVLLSYGEEDARAKKDAKAIYKNLSKYHPEPPVDQRREKQDLFLVPLPTRLQGTRLLTDAEFNMLPTLLAFIDARLSRQSFEWIQRRGSQ